MIPWELLDEARVPGADNVLRLYRRGEEFSIRVDGRELMNSRAHASEDALAELSCRPLAERRSRRVLIGGLGMGFTLAAALRTLGRDAHVVQSEIVPAVVRWNAGPLAALSGHALADPRVEVIERDVAEVIDAGRARYDAILLDVDNGPESFTRKANGRLYARDGLRQAKAALRPGGALWIWSADRRDGFFAPLRRVGFEAFQHRVVARSGTRRPRHTLWEARLSG
jgi:spermidine synthase